MFYGKRMNRRGRLVMAGQSAVYHVVNRTAFRRMVLDGEAKAVFLKILRKQAAFAGVELLAYCVMTNHFHVLVRVPEPCEVDDVELMRRYRLMYGGHCPGSVPDVDVMEQLLAKGGAEADSWRERLHARMHRLSPFMAELKQRFTIWYNSNRGNQGTVWSERFRSVIVQDDPEFTAPVAAYVDLNPVRAGVVEDPAEYGFSSYALAMRGDRAAYGALLAVFHGQRSWDEAIRSYRVLLFGKGAVARDRGGRDQGMIDPERSESVIAQGGKLSWGEYLRMQVGYFTRGGALGSAEFIETLAIHVDTLQERSRKLAGRISTLHRLDGSMCALRNLNRGIG